MATETKSLHDLTAETIDHKASPLSAYAGKVLLVVNTASECGFTPQYAGLEKLWREYQGRGFAILGFPSNEFGAQEPGSESEIKSFCETRFGVSFPLFAKVSVKGPAQSPVYRFLTAQHGEPKWNFHKYLVGKNGQVIQAYESKVAPDDPQLRAAIESALAAPG